MLTKSEHDILVDRANGLLSKEVADNRGLHIRTVESHLCSARRKLRSKTTVQAVARALRDGVIKHSEILLVAWLCVGGDRYGPTEDQPDAAKAAGCASSAS